MSKFYSFLLILITNSIFSQDYKPLLAEGNKWQVSFSASMQNYNCFFFQGGSSYSYKIKGDSLVNGKSYKKIYFNFNSLRPDNKRACDETSYFDTNDHFAALLREDIVEKKVYRNINGTANETVLYDFSLSVGNSLPYQGYDFDKYAAGTLISISTGNVFDEVKKVFKTHVQGMNTDYNYPGYAIYEGVGSSNGLLEYPGDRPFEYGHWLECFETAAGISCKSTLSNSENLFKASNPKLYYSKTDKSFKVILPENKNVRIDFYESSGQLFKQINTKSNQLFYLNQEFKGVLFYKITDDKVYSGKIILE